MPDSAITTTYESAPEDEVRTDLPTPGNDDHGPRDWLLSAVMDLTLGLHADPRKFIHLKDVRIHSPNDVQCAPLWRGALDRIDGWSFGIPVVA